jgi:hypothetical protein
VATLITGSWLNGLSQSEIVEVLKGPFGNQMHQWAASHVSYFWWVRTSLLGTTHCRNGSVFFVSVGGNLFAVTAAHVYHGFIADKMTSGNRIIARIGNLRFDPQARLRGLGSEGIDIATFDIAWDELRRVGKQAIAVDASNWPPPHPFSGQTTFLVGFPGAARFWLNTRAISFGQFVAMQPVGTAADQAVTCPFERQYWIDTLGNGLPSEGCDLGGISGGPLLLPMETGGTWSMVLGGVISEAQSVGFETVVSVPAHFIAADGAVNDKRSAPIRFAMKA